jgi:hypothetical protein
MVNALLQVEEEVAIGGQATLCQIIVQIYIDSIVTPFNEFHAKLKRNAETKRIKAAFTSAGLTNTAKCVTFLRTTKVSFLRKTRQTYC